MVDLEDLKAKALSATPGPWAAKDYGDYEGKEAHWYIDTAERWADYVSQPDETIASNHCDQERAEKDIKFIAAANPAAVIELIDRLEKSESERDALKAEVERLTPLQFRPAPCYKFCESMAFKIEIKQLKAKIEAAQKREPDSWRVTAKTFCGTHTTDKEIAEHWMKTGEAYPLYASPVPAQHPEISVEELLRLTKIYQRDGLVRVPAQQPAEVTTQYPMQPILLDKGLPLFEKNPIVDWLCEKHGLNEIGIWWQVNNVEQKYIEQIYQLIGYSIRGYDELSEVSDSSFDRAHAIAEQLLKGGER